MGEEYIQFWSGITSNTCDDYEVVIAYARRDETPENFQKDFNSKIKFIEIKNFSRRIGLHDLKAVMEVKKVIKKENPDIVHLHSAKAGVIGRLAINDKKIRMFYTPHGYSFLKKDDFRFVRFIYRSIEKVMTLLRCRCTTIACSNGEYEEALKLSSNSICISNGINIDKALQTDLKIDNKNDNSKLKVFTIGRICKQKNPKMFNEIAKAFPDMDFIWIGDGKDSKYLTSSNIRVTGWLDRKKIFNKLVKADIFLLPSLWEGLPISLLEAMLYKRICVVSNISGNNEVIKNNVTGFVCKNYEDYIETIRNIKDKKYDLHKIRENASDLIISSYNSDLMGKRYKEVYKNNKIEIWRGNEKESSYSFLLF